MPEQQSSAFLKAEQRIETSQVDIDDIVARVPFQGCFEIFFGGGVTAEAVGMVEVNHASQIIRDTHEFITPRIFVQILRPFYDVGEFLFGSRISTRVVKNDSWKV